MNPKEDPTHPSMQMDAPCHKSCTVSINTAIWCMWYLITIVLEILSVRVSDLCTPGEQYDSLECWWVVEEIFNERGDVGSSLQSYAAKLILGRERERGRER